MTDEPGHAKVREMLGEPATDPVAKIVRMMERAIQGLDSAQVERLRIELRRLKALIEPSPPGVHADPGFAE